MATVKVKLNGNGVRQLLQSQEAMSICREYADRIAARCGDGYEVTTYTGRTRVNASVVTATPEAIRDNADNDTLLNALGGV